MNKNMNAMDTTKFVRRAMDEKIDDLIGALSDGLLCVKQARRAEVHKWGVTVDADGTLRE